MKQYIYYALPKSFKVLTKYNSRLAEGLFDIGQITKEELKILNDLVKSNILKKSKEPFAGFLKMKTVYRYAITIKEIHERTSL